MSKKAKRKVAKKSNKKAHKGPMLSQSEMEYFLAMVRKALGPKLEKKSPGKAVRG